MKYFSPFNIDPYFCSWSTSIHEINVKSPDISGIMYMKSKSTWFSCFKKAQNLCVEKQHRLAGTQWYCVGPCVLL